MSLRRLTCGLFLAGIVAGLAVAQSAEQILAQTGLPPDLVAVLTVEGAGGKALFVIVHINERSLASNMKPALAEALRPFLGKNAVLVWAYSEAGATFDPTLLLFSQSETIVGLSSTNVVPLDGDLLAGALPPARPVAGVVVLGSVIDPAVPFAIAYGDLASVTLALSVGTATAQATASAQANAQATAQASAQASTQGIVQNPTPCPCPPSATSPCPCDPCQWMCRWWTACDACDPCAGRGLFILPLLLLLLGL